MVLHRARIAFPFKAIKTKKFLIIWFPLFRIVVQYWLDSCAPSFVIKGALHFMSLEKDGIFDSLQARQQFQILFLVKSVDWFALSASVFPRLFEDCSLTQQIFFAALWVLSCSAWSLFICGLVDLSFAATWPLFILAPFVKKGPGLFLEIFVNGLACGALVWA